MYVHACVHVYVHTCVCMHVRCIMSMVVVGSKMGVGVYIPYRDGTTGEECKVLSTPLSAHDKYHHPTNKVHCRPFI